MNTQEVFDKVVAHLRQQARRALREDNSHAVSIITCAYRAKDGAKCAVGCLIDDDEYGPWMESLSPKYILSHHKAMPSLIMKLEEHLYILNDLQSIHDKHGPEQWEACWKSCAEVHKVIYTPPIG